MVKYYKISICAGFPDEKQIYFTSNEIRNLEEAIRWFNVIYPGLIMKRALIDIMGIDENNIPIVNITCFKMTGILLQLGSDNWDCQYMKSWDEVLERRSEWEG